MDLSVPPLPTFSQLPVVIVRSRPGVLTSDKHAAFSTGPPAFIRQASGSFLPQNRASAPLAR